MTGGQVWSTTKIPKNAIEITLEDVSMLDLREMLKTGIHFGHKTSRWCPKMRPYIWGSKNKVHLIDIAKTAALLEKIGALSKEVASKGGVFLFVGTKKAAQPIIEKTAKSLSMPYVVNRWVGGTLSNYDQVKKAITRLLHLRDVVTKSSGYYKKKEIVMIQKEILRLEKNIGGIIELSFPPAALIVVDAKKERAAVKEAAALGVPVIAMVDTNTDPEGVSYIIPSNDDSPKAIELVLNYLENCIKDGQKIYADNKAQEVKQAAEAKQAAKTQAPKDVVKEADLAPKEQRISAEPKAAHRPVRRPVYKKDEHK